uniref:Uncharacterized protein n=1 Tax=Picea glauca TaxID=3330 RepID=A0A101M5J7_PICGL|nr:hypothetical protein ABT39_MTgene1114 [Picea glauca]
MPLEPMTTEAMMSHPVVPYRLFDLMLTLLPK